MGFVIILTLFAVWIVISCFIRIRKNIKQQRSAFWQIFFLIIGLLILTYAIIIGLMLASGVEC